MIEVLPTERWPELKEIFAREFSADLPNTGKADIIADVDSGEIKSFLVAEHLMRIGQIHSDGANPRKLIRWLEDNMPRDTSVITIASELRFETLFELLKMRKMEGTIFRRDF